MFFALDFLFYFYSMATFLIAVHVLFPLCRYLLYEVNMGEGFNLRRDVYMRVASLVRQLRDSGHNYILVLPPWGSLYHWRTLELGDLWFDLQSLSRFIPVLELQDYLREVDRPVIDQLYHLQHFADWDKWEEKYDFIQCPKIPYFQATPGHWKGWFWKYDEIYASNVTCLSVMGFAKTLKPLVLSSWNTSIRSIMLDRAEVILHDEFGSADYWKARRSMRYSAALVKIADDFRRSVLNSTDVNDGTVMDPDWTKVKVRSKTTTGGPYIAVHWRRQDYLMAHGDELPSIEGTAATLSSLAERLNLKTIFLATDASDKGIAF
ncbi:unnamed protein product [Soboliphyme baturini]|uniref:GDP-fucose protein O-fucosyltransferase 2 n=1 Tax=Soboliphyme baturini TaxID=241478 RepID=A0A183IL46_9BILA|nr:unnamed protein product [Soboliphyme baturini]